MKLYNVPRNTLVKVLPQPVEEIISEDTGQTEMNFMDPEEIRVPIAAPPIEKDEYIYFDHVDGMYSFCYNMDGEICHMAAWTEVEPIDTVEENIETLRKYLKRGGRGKNGDQPLKYVPICEMSDEWLANTITYETEHRPDNDWIQLYKWELKYRKDNGINITE